MDLTLLIVLSVIVVVLGQVVLRRTKNYTWFYIIHLIVLVGVVVGSVIVAGNQSGGVHWPWWFFAVFPAIPVLLSLIGGSILHAASRSNKA